MTELIKKKVFITKKPVPNSLPNSLPKIIIENIINKKILELLNTIHAKYPNKFPKENIIKEYENIVKQIKYALQISNNSNSIQNKKNDVNKYKKPEKKIEKKVNVKQYDVKDRCQARVWNNIFERETRREAVEMNNEFTVSDFNDINIKKFSSKYIIGKQCSRKIIKNKDSTNGTEENKYCFQHSKHNPHGNYFEPPSQEICYHYMKDGNYL